MWPSDARTNILMPWIAMPTKIYCFTLVKSADSAWMMGGDLSLGLRASGRPVSSFRYQYFRWAYPAVMKKSWLGLISTCMAGFDSLFWLILVSLRQSHTNKPLSFGSPNDIKKSFLGEKSTASMPYLWPYKCLISVYEIAFLTTVTSLVACSGWLEVIDSVQAAALFLLSS